MNGRPKRAVLRPLRTTKTISFQPTERAQKILDRVKSLSSKTVTDLMNDAVIIHYGGFSTDSEAAELVEERVG